MLRGICGSLTGSQCTQTNARTGKVQVPRPTRGIKYVVILSKFVASSIFLQIYIEIFNVIISRHTHPVLYLKDAKLSFIDA